MNTHQSSTLASLFNETGCTFEIPAYQRAYSWGEKEIEQFITDLRESQSTYYLGHFLFEYQTSVNSNKFFIIDGQQRLTTCIIFFSVLHKELSSRIENGEIIEIDLNSIMKTYLIDSETYIEKLTTVSYDQNFFMEEIIRQRSLVNLELDTSSKKRIRKAKQLFQQVIQAEKDTKKIISWSKLLETAVVSKFVVTSKEQAAQIFSFQNDRGKNLSNLEILKSYLMLQVLLYGTGAYAPELSIKRIERNISYIYTQTESSKIKEDDVLNYYWRAVSGQGFSSSQVIIGVKKKLSELEPSTRASWIEDFVSDLAASFYHVSDILANNNEFARDLRDLNNMRIAFPILLRLYRDNADENAKLRLFKFLENITFRYLLRGGRADIESRLNHHFFNNNKNLDTDTVHQSINDFIYNLQHAHKNGNWWYYYWNDDSLLEYLNYDFYNNPVDNYLLWKYERYLSDKSYTLPPDITYHDLVSQESIEHIAPQTPPQGENLLSGYGIYDHDTEPTEGIRTGKWIHKLGNLMLVAQSQNSSMGNRSFSFKISSLKEKSLLKQQQKLTDFLDIKINHTDVHNMIWDKKAIVRRHNHIIEAAMKIWDLSKI